MAGVSNTDTVSSAISSAIPLELRKSLSDQAIKSISELADKDGVDIWNLRFKPIATILSNEEAKFVENLKNEKALRWDSPSHHIVAILKATRLCNLRCTYCNSWRSGPGQIMPFSTLAKIIFDILSSDNIQEVDFVWHGGEVTLLPLEYVEKALWVQQYFSPPHKIIANSIQTNATRLTDKWIDLLKRYKVSVGVSIDGPPEVHDQRRFDKKGRPTSKQVAHGIKKLKDSGISFGALAVVDECVIRIGPKAYLDYLVDLDIKAVAILNALPANETSGLSEKWFTWNDFSQFMRDLFAIWWTSYRNKIVIRELEALVESVTRGTTGICIYRENCMGRYITIDPNGDVSACDKYVGDTNFVFGNIVETRLAEMLTSSINLKHARQGVDAAKALTSGCPEFAICSGGCPHDIRLRQLHGQETQISCCGLAPLISDIRAATLGKN